MTNHFAHGYQSRQQTVAWSLGWVQSSRLVVLGPLALFRRPQPPLLPQPPHPPHPPQPPHPPKPPQPPQPAQPSICPNHQTTLAYLFKTSLKLVQNSSKSILPSAFLPRLVFVKRSFTFFAFHFIFAGLRSVMTLAPSNSMWKTRTTLTLNTLGQSPFPSRPWWQPASWRETFPLSTQEGDLEVGGEETAGTYPFGSNSSALQRWCPLLISRVTSPWRPTMASPSTRMPAVLTSKLGCLSLHQWSCQTAIHTRSHSFQIQKSYDFGGVCTSIHVLIGRSFQSRQKNPMKS